MRVSQAFVRERDATRATFEEIAGGYLDARVGAQRLVALYFPFVDLLSEHRGCARARARAACSSRTARCSVGELIAFLLYLNLFFAPIQQLSQVFDSYQQARVVARAHRRAARDADERAAAGRPGRPAPRLARRRRASTHVRFRYPNTIDDALRGVDLHVRPGETVALVGETGAGKSTVIKLVARFYDPTAGVVTRRRRRR